MTRDERAHAAAIRQARVDADLDQLAAEQSAQVARREAEYRSSRPNPIAAAIVAVVLAAGLVLIVYGLVGLAQMLT